MRARLSGLKENKEKKRRKKEERNFIYHSHVSSAFEVVSLSIEFALSYLQFGNAIYQSILSSIYKQIL